MKIANNLLFLILGILVLFSCTEKEKSIVIRVNSVDSLVYLADHFVDTISIEDIVIKKELLYDKYTLEDKYPYKDTSRYFQWEKIKEKLALLENAQKEPALWAVLQNYKNMNKEAPTTRKFVRNEYKLVSDTLGVSRYQSAPLYLLQDSIIPEIYGRDGSLVRIIENDTTSNFVTIETIRPREKWLVPRRYLSVLGSSDSISFEKVVVVDVTNQNITTLERNNYTWLVRSMNPATTGRHAPPYAQETPVGMYLIQQKKTKMVYLHDGSSHEVAGFAPYASRFTNGAYLHGVPSALPRTEIIEYSYSLGTTPRSHMCVRNASSHAKFIFDWSVTKRTIVFVID